MSLHTTALPLGYRETELTAIFRSIRAGDSCSIVGVSGMAKSNLFRHLLNPEVRAHYLGTKWQSYIFVPIDANEAPELTEDVISDLVWQRLNAAAGDDHPTGPGPDRFIPSNKQSQFTLAHCLSTVLGSPSAQLVFLFDQFDAIYKHLDGRFFANLRAIRDRHKYRISYLTFTREHLGQLCRSNEHEEFEELVSPNVIILGPYSHADALLLVERVSRRYGPSLRKASAERLITLTGAHPGLLKAATMALIKQQLELPSDEPAAAEALLNNHDVRLECQKLWMSISPPEQAFLRALSDSGHVTAQAEVKRVLIAKGLVQKQQEQWTVSLPLLSLYIPTAKSASEAATRIHAGCFRIDTAGEVWVNQDLVTPSLPRKELLLLEYLCLEPGRLRTRDEIIAVVYPDEFRSGESISDDAVNALFKRLRERLNLFSNSGNQIVTLRGKGYRLDPG